MEKIAIVVDSSSGLTKKQAEENGWFFIPLHIEIDDKLYDDGINISNDTLFNIFNANSKMAKTSSTKLGEVIELIEKLNQSYDKILIYPISKFLSGQYQSIKMLESDYPKLRVVESTNIAAPTVLDLINFEENIKNGISFEDAFAQFKVNKNSISLMPKYNDFLVKGGRLSPAAATLARLLKIVPIISFSEGQLLKEGKGRVFAKTVFNVIEDKTKNYNSDSELIILHSNNSEIQDYINFAKEKINGQIYVGSIPSVVAIHTGPEAVVVILYPKKLNNNIIGLTKV
ncbi:DegV domain-containing protein [Mycoplasma anatis]|uniref:DegV family protein n=1 Tax=Mycoplasmopsis anatis TaxID=171279 RepID=UPI001C4DDEED|nr:DegV family protein [Mycoplasmopsis anatis]MBW0595724.1 DegV domain-containing protein [Mycoplasmopsis anatis]MBW0597353.1 DegV domain-containing protein [Mycoplasmopsis anatis]MBW0600526.1 DegV domain-containing protein [Mycoplasmopsis anatis]